MGGLSGLSGLTGLSGVAGGRRVATNITDTFDAALGAAWTTRLGTFQTASGALQGATLVADGIERMPNGNMETGNPPTGYPTASGSTLARAAEERPGGAGSYSLLATTGTSYLCANYPNVAIIQYATYLLSAWMKQLTGSMVQIRANVGVDSGEKNYAEWTNFVGSGQITTANVYMQLLVGGTGGKTGMFDDISLQAKMAIATANLTANGTLTADMPMPATGAIPRSIICRYTDLLNYWEIRFLPNTAGNDTFIIEHAAGVMTTRATADVDWTASGTDRVFVTLADSAISVDYQKQGGDWTAGCYYASAASNQTITAHGIGGYNVGADICSYFQFQP